MAKNPYRFVKATGRDKYWRHQEKELLDLVDPDTGELKRELALAVDCVVCGSREHNLAFRKEGFRFVKCCRCGLLFVNPQLDEGRLIASYSEDESHERWVDVLLSPAQQAYDARYRFGAALRRLEKMVPRGKRGRILDIGCSIGLFLKLARDRGWTPYGLEINKKAVRHAREVYKLPVQEKLLHELDYPEGYFQVISLWGVLEHTSHPDVILEQVYPLLDPQGILVILVPNGNSLATRIMHEHSPTFGGRNHLWYFTPEMLTRLLRRKNFRVKHAYTQLAQFEETLHYLRYNHPFLEAQKIEREEFRIPPGLRRRIEKYMEGELLGYKLVVFAGKEGRRR